MWAMSWFALPVLRFGNREANGFLSLEGGLYCHQVEKDVHD